VRASPRRDLDSPLDAARELGAGPQRAATGYASPPWSTPERSTEPGVSSGAISDRRQGV